MKGSDLLVKALESEGVEYIFGIPGEENLDFLDALRRSSIRLVVTTTPRAGCGLHGGDLWPTHRQDRRVHVDTRLSATPQAWVSTNVLSLSKLGLGQSAGSGR